MTICIAAFFYEAYMKLIIVESPTKARTLGKFLKGSFDVEATMGHIRDLPKASLGVDVEDSYAPRYIIPRDRRGTVSDLRKKAKKAEQVILATDPDREGEAIAWHVGKLLEEKKTVKPEAITRIVFHEITQAAVEKALSEPRDIDMKLVDAQQARRVLDRLVGYKLSPLLWKKLSKRWLSAGRVQSVAVRLIVEREREIEAFNTMEYWNIHGLFGADKKTKETLNALLISKDGKKYEVVEEHELFDGTYTTTRTRIESEDAMKQILSDIADPFTVSSVEKRQVTRSPSAPYTTSTLQQDAGRKFYFSSKKTMQLAQKLYEKGYITYHRTDSVNLSDKFVKEARAYIKREHGADFVPASARTYKTKSKIAQEAHEAIRPTDANRSPNALAEEKDLYRDHVRLYEAIWKRAVASQAKSAIFDSTTVTITSSNGYTFETKGSVIKFEGYLKIVGRRQEDAVIPDVSEGQKLVLQKTDPTQHETAPPPRYTEARLVKTLEEKGIGRPSTYAPVISTIQERQYVIRDNKVLKPTSLGEAVTDFLVNYFPEILRLPFTATLENDLDDIALGVKEWAPVVDGFYKPFEQALDKTYEIAEKVKPEEELIDESCPTCGKQLVIRIGRYGKFVACTSFPDCKYTRQHAEKIDTPCPKCKGDIVIKKTRSKKTFYGCSNYPNCTFAAWKKEDIK